MLSMEHELLVDLFRRDDRLAVELLRRCAGISLHHARITRGPAELSQVTPTEYRADAVFILRGDDDAPVTGVIVEVQRGRDPAKRRSWPLYIAALHADLGCPVFLLVLAPDPGVAHWASQPIELGHPAFQLTPIALAFNQIPRVRDRRDARRLPALAVLSALAHPTLDVAEAAVDAISDLPEDLARLYLDAILMALPDAVRRILEAHMQSYEYRSEFARKYYGQGREEGREAGREEGREAGRAEGRQEVLVGLRAAARTLALGKVGAISDRQAAAIEASTSPDALTALVTALGLAATADEARAALECATG